MSRYERMLQAKGYRFLAGVDEAGRGPLAGPVVAVACIIPPTVQIKGIKDSKVLTPEARKTLFRQIVSQTIVGVGVVGEQEIDQINILQASLLAMKKAVLALSITPDFILVDGTFPIDVPVPQKPVIDGDARLVSIGAASIVAKVTRDEIMKDYDIEYPNYGFKDHKGYATPAHIAALETHGPCPIHRMSFRPLVKHGQL